MSALRDAINAKKGCPFCNFGPCREDACIFYTLTKRDGSSCAVLATQANSAQAASTANYLLYKVETVQRISPDQIGREELKEQARKLEGMLLLLDETICVPGLSQSFRSTIESVREKIAESQRLVFAALGVLA